MKAVFSFFVIAMMVACYTVSAQVSCFRCDELSRQDRLSCCNAGLFKDKCCYNYVLPNTGLYERPQYPAHSGGPGGYHGIGYAGGVGYPYPGQPAGPGYPYPNLNLYPPPPRSY